MVTLQTKLCEMNTKKDEMKSKGDRIRAQWKELDSLKEEYRLFCEKKVSLKSKLELLATRKSDLDKRTQALNEKLEAAKELEVKAERRNKDAKVALDAATKLQAARDHHEESVVASDKKEILRIKERKEKAEILMIELEAKLEQSRKEDLERKGKMEEENQKILTSIAEVQASIQKKKEEIFEMGKKHSGYKVSMENEIKEAESRRDQMKSLLIKTTEARAIAFRHAVLKSGAVLIEKSKYPC
jgi:DNA repair exonuclease SbcCD ATPase subunit